jgi:hypothetical protein
VLQTAACTIFGGLLWGGILLIIFALWLGLKYAADERNLVLPWIIGVLGLTGLGLAGWYAFVLWMQKAPDQRAVALAGQRRASALILLAGGAALLLIALFLAFGEARGSALASLRANLGEALGLFLFSLVSIGAGYSLLTPPRQTLAPVDLDPVRNLFPLIRVVLFLLGLVLVVTFVILAIYPYRIGLAYFPQLAGLLLFSMLCLALGLWMTTITVPDAFTTRVFVLVLGGASGLILFIATLAWAIAWREQVFLSGIATWQGEESWRMWLSVYLLLIALALVFGSLLLARADIRANPVLRRVLFGYSAVLNGLLLLAMLIVVNIAFYAMVPYTFDWTQTRGLHSLAQYSKSLLHSLKRPTHVFVILSSRFPAYSEVRGLMDNMSAETNMLDITYLEPTRDVVQLRDLGERFPELVPAGKLFREEASGRGILLVYGDLPKDKLQKVSYTFIPDRKIYDEQPGFGGKRGNRIFKGEVEVMRELNFLLQAKEKRKVYFLQGDAEIDITNSDIASRLDLRGEMSLLGAATLVEKLKKDNFEVKGLTFSKEFAAERKKDKDNIVYAGEEGADKRPEVPKDAYALIVAGASNPLGAEALGAIEKYIDRGGRLLVLLDIVLTNDLKAMKESGIEELLRKYGIESTDEFVLVYPSHQFVDPFKVVVTPPLKTENTLGKQFLGEPFELKWVRVVRPGNAPGRFKAEVLLESVLSNQNLAIAEKQVSALRNPLSLFADLKQAGLLLERVSKPPPVAVTVTEGEKPRMCVVGDTEFISNNGLTSPRERTRENHYALFVSALEWMAEHGEVPIGVRPKETASFSLPPKVADESTRIHLIPMWLMLLTVIGLGTGIWLVRRR